MFGINKKIYYKKLIKSGEVYEVLEYERGVFLGETNNKNGRSEKAGEEETKRHRKETIRKAKQTVRRLINANMNAWGEPPIFLTLTFAENVTDIKKANYEFKKFRERLEYQIQRKLKYVVVIEFQKRGAIHYHAIFFNLPFIKYERLAEIWKNGYIWINEIDNVDNVGAYVTKYMTKEEQDKVREDKLKGKKSYFTSRGLKKPEEIIDKKKIERIEKALSNAKVFESDFENDHLGKITYKQYNPLRKK